MMPGEYRWLEDKPGTFDHRGGTITNNMFYRAAGLSGTIDVPIYVADSPDTTIYYNTVFDQGNYPNAIEYRYASTNNMDVRNNLVNKAIVARNGSSGTVVNNVTTATATMFVNPAAGSVTSCSQRRPPPSTVVLQLAWYVTSMVNCATHSPTWAPTSFSQRQIQIKPRSSPTSRSRSMRMRLMGRWWEPWLPRSEGQALTYSILSGNTNHALLRSTPTQLGDRDSRRFSTRPSVWALRIGRSLSACRLCQSWRF